MATVKWAPSRKHSGCALAAYGLSDDDLKEAARPVASAEHSETELVGVLRAAM